MSDAYRTTESLGFCDHQVTQAIAYYSSDDRTGDQFVMMFFSATRLLYDEVRPEHRSAYPLYYCIRCGDPLLPEVIYEAIQSKRDLGVNLYRKTPAPRRSDLHLPVNVNADCYHRDKVLLATREQIWMMSPGYRKEEDEARWQRFVGLFGCPQCLMLWAEELPKWKHLLNYCLPPKLQFLRSSKTLRNM